MRFAALVGAMLVAAGCGAMGHRSHSEPAKPHSSDPRKCMQALAGFRTCLSASATNSRATIERRTGSGWSVVAAPLKPLDPTTAWGKLWLSPDSETLLAEWRYACDGHMAVFVPVEGGEPRIVTGERRWIDAAASSPLGWTAKGEARVRVLRAWGRHGKQPAGVFLFDPDSPAGKPTKQDRGC